MYGFYTYWLKPSVDKSKCVMIDKTAMFYPFKRGLRHP